jgi:hypothetical protein
MAAKINRHTPCLAGCFQSTYDKFSKGGLTSAKFLSDLRSIRASLIFIAVKKSSLYQFTSRGEPVDKP